jgi:hypothetical protein
VFRFFRREQVKVARFEEFRRDQVEVVNSIFVFIGAKPLSGVRSKERNVIPYERKITDVEYEHVARLFAHDIAKLEKLLGWNCSDWKL